MKMAQEERNRIVEWLDLLRKQGPVLRQHVGEWIATVKEEPRLLWETPTLRYVVYATGGIVLLWGAVSASNMLVPPPPPSAKPQATTADYHVVCSDTRCAKHFVIHRTFGFRGFPVSCPACQKETGKQAIRCNSQSCGGRWVAPVELNAVRSCPTCGGQIH